MGRSDRRGGFTDYAVARRPHLRRFAYALCGDWHAADDLVQIALARAYVAWPRIEREGSEDAYVRRTLTRVAVDQSRRPWRREQAGLHGVEEVEARTGDPGEREDLIRALGSLPEMQRRTVVLRHWWGLSVAETARDLGISEGSVKSHTSRALIRLQGLLAAQELSQ
jgi:RNA polymerase sigma-70 factor (sigma-E family)